MKSATAEEPQRQHRCGAARFHDEEQRQRDDADQRGTDHRCGAPAARWRLDERKHQARQGDRREDRAEDVEPTARRGAATFGNFRRAHCEQHEAQRRVHQEGPGPGIVVDEEAAHHRSDRRGDAAERRPRADGLAALGCRKRGADQRQASRHEQGGADSLQGAGRDERIGACRCGAADRSESEQCRADHEDPAPAEAIAERAANEQQRSEEQRVGLYDPLGLRRCRAKFALQSPATRR